MSPSITIYQEGNSFFSNKEEAIALAGKSYFGELKSGKVVYSIYEAIYLIEKNRAKLEGKLTKEKLNKIKHSKEYLIFKDLRDKGLILKEGLKFGSDFRVYEKGKSPGKDHAAYLLHIADSSAIKLKDFCAKARVAHSTAKKLLLAIPDSEHDISYYEVNWKSIL